jgi:hypothetical protein
MLALDEPKEKDRCKASRDVLISAVKFGVIGLLSYLCLLLSSLTIEIEMGSGTKYNLTVDLQHSCLTHPPQVS